jgi:hypothetical protein
VLICRCLGGGHRFIPHAAAGLERGERRAAPLHGGEEHALGGLIQLVGPVKKGLSAVATQFGSVLT